MPKNVLVNTSSYPFFIQLRSTKLSSAPPLLLPCSCYCPVLALLLARSYPAPDPAKYSLAAYLIISTLRHLFFGSLSHEKKGQSLIIFETALSENIREDIRKFGLVTLASIYKSTIPSVQPVSCTFLAPDQHLLYFCPALL